MLWFQRIPSGLWIVLGTLFLTAVAYLVRGETLFSPGELRQVTAGRAKLGGVRSHAELSHRCSACHAPVDHSTTMSALCLDCHRDVGDQIARREPLHGRFNAAENCRQCHTEHQGPAASLTTFAHFDHRLTSFPLTGRHQLLACALCHKDQIHKGTPTSCVACHAEPKVHQGRFGTDCAKCHSTATWKGATITAEFHKFPIYHGGGKNRGECATCHATPGDFKQYTCYGCHRHEPQKTAEKHLKWNIVELATCAKCHPTGRKRPDQPAKPKALAPSND